MRIRQENKYFVLDQSHKLSRFAWKDAGDTLKVESSFFHSPTWQSSTSSLYRKSRSKLLTLSISIGGPTRTYQSSPSLPVFTHFWVKFVGGIHHAFGLAPSSVRTQSLEEHFNLAHDTCLTFHYSVLDSHSRVTSTLGELLVVLLAS